MSRQQGKPNLTDCHFATTRDEPLIARLSLRITPSMLEEIKQQDNWQEFVREAISEKLKLSNDKVN